MRTKSTPCSWVAHHPYRHNEQTVPHGGRYFRVSEVCMVFDWIGSCLLFFVLMTFGALYFSFTAHLSPVVTFLGLSVFAGRVLRLGWCGDSGRHGSCRWLLSDEIPRYHPTGGSFAIEKRRKKREPCSLSVVFLSSEARYMPFLHVSSCAWLIYGITDLVSACLGSHFFEIVAIFSHKVSVFPPLLSIIIPSPLSVWIKLNRLRIVYFAKPSDYLWNHLRLFQGSNSYGLGLRTGSEFGSWVRRGTWWRRQWLIFENGPGWE